MSILVIPAPVGNAAVAERDTVILRYYLSHSVDACIANFNVSKSTVNRATRNPSALAALNLTRDQAFAEHERNCKPARVHPNLRHCRPDDARVDGRLLPSSNAAAPALPSSRPVTLAGVLRAVEEKKKQKNRAT
jgi:hypothetical protein